MTKLKPVLPKGKTYKETLVERFKDDKAEKKAGGGKEKIISVAEVRRHNKTNDLWLVIGDTVWDFTEFGPAHPGGFAVIRKYAGRDATRAYSSVHPPYLLHLQLDDSKIVGKLAREELEEWWRSEGAREEREEREREKREREGSKL